jgi:predicted patatin/cPLA2 family phospholipase
MLQRMEKTGREQVIDLLQRRREGERGPEHLALGVEGGGLRGIVSAGMLAALHDAGFTAELFDSIYGASAGALGGAYFIDGSIEKTMPLYYRDVPSFFLDWSRLLKRQPILALDRLVDQTIVTDRPLDFGKVLASRKLRIIASDIGEAAKLGPRQPQPVEAECFPPAASPEELRELLRASTRIPLAGGPPVVVADPEERPDRRTEAHAYLDAFITEGLPVDSPIADGATHLVLLATKPYAQSRSENAAVAGFTRWRLGRLNPNLVHQLRTIPDRAARRATVIDRGQTTPQEGEPTIWCVSPQEDVGVPRLNADPERMLEAAKAGYRLVRKELGLDQPTGFETDPEFRAVFA